MPDKETLDAWHKDPRNWKWGFYNNKKDERVLVPKKNPAMGMTINLAHSRSIVLFALALLIPALIVILIAVGTGK